jgi:N-methylhydantoinase B
VSVDPLTLAVVTGGFVSTAEEMGWVLRRTSFSEAVREGADCSATVFDAEGSMIGQGNYAPAHLGASPFAVAAVREHFPAAEMHPGDAFLVNDPAVNSGHLPDIFSIAPAFSDDELVGYTVVTAHHVDVGGAAPGSQAIVGVSDLHQEGIRIVPVRHFAAGVPDPNVFALIAGNVRVPDQVVGDLKAQYNANQVGVARIRSLVERFGLDVYRECVATLIERSETAMGEAIAAIPDGVYEYENRLDDSGPGTPPVIAKVRIEVSGSELSVDYSGSSPATASGLNAYLPFTLAYTYHAIKCLADPHLPQNAGTMRPVVVRAPEGSVLNALYPTPSGGRTLLTRLIVDAIFGAMAAAVPERVQAASSQLCNSTIGGIDAETGKPFVYYDLTFGSTGATDFKDGAEGMTSGFNTANVPVEVHESAWPVRVRSVGFVADTGGAGRFRGGMAVRREVENLTNHGRLTNLHDRQEIPPQGLAGGKPGAVGRIEMKSAGGLDTELHSKSIVEIGPGDAVVFQTCAGGGYGDPLSRDPERVLRDVSEGWVSAERAASEYGVRIEQRDGEPVLLGAETEELRSRMTERTPTEEEQA